MKQRQTLREYMVKEIEAHQERTGEGITAFCVNIGIQTQRIKGFMAGVTSLRVDTADRILDYIDNCKLDSNH